MANDYWIAAKVALLGDPAVGKTSLFNRYTKDFFSRDYRVTIGAQFAVESENTKHGIVKLQVWDLASGHRFQTVLPTYLRGSKAVVLVYDLTRKSTLFNIPRYVEMVKSACESPILYLVGNKLDLVVHDEQVRRTVYREDIEAATEYISELQRKFKLDSVLSYMSAKTGEGVKDLFKELAEGLARTYSEGS
ncbi:MAG: Rab family GTPase [Candidatus Thorarchaeota archaeon]